MPLARRPKIIVGLAVLVFTATAGALLQALSSSPPGQRIPALDGVTVVGWRSDAVALAWEPSESGPRAYFFVDIHTGERTALPPLPPLPKGKSRGGGVQETYNRSLPKLSPDGQWLLYKETNGWGWMDSAGDAGYRWRLVHLTDGKSRLWPADGTFQRMPNPERDNHYDFTQTTLWLPHSQGWAELEECRGQSGSLTYYPVSSLKPSALATPTLGDDDSFQELLPSGQGVFSPNSTNRTALSNPGRISLRLLPLVPGSLPEEQITVPLPPGTDSYSLVHIDTTSLLIMTHTDAQGIARWLPTLLQLGTPPGHSTLWRLPKNGSAPQCVREFGFDARDLSVAPGGKRLYYWPRRQRRDDVEPAYAVDLP